MTSVWSIDFIGAAGSRSKQPIQNFAVWAVSSSGATVKD